MTDPICGMEVDPNSAAGKHQHDGQIYYFCSLHCLEQFKEDPEKFLKSSVNEQRTRVHPESRHPHPDLPPSRGKASDPLLPGSPLTTHYSQLITHTQW